MTLPVASGGPRGPALSMEMLCIRCGDCARACPTGLLPQQLLWNLRADHADRAQQQGLFDCSECGACDRACPSHIPLVAIFRDAKAVIRQRALDGTRAHAAGERHESRRLRLERESRERAERDLARQSGVASVDAVAAALERARARKAAAKDADPPA